MNTNQQEIERKFLVINDSWRKNVIGIAYKQGYLNSDPDRTVRIRVAGDKGFLTIKGKPIEGSISRPEFEYEIPITHAEAMYETLCEPEKIEKVRHLLNYKGKIWEIDVFKGKNEGLTIAEIELSSEDEKFDLPEWVGNDVSLEEKYFNSNLAKNPYKHWIK